MTRRMLSLLAAAVLGLMLLAGPAAAQSRFNGPADGACVTQGVQSLRGAIGGVASSTAPGTIAAVIHLHLTGEACGR
jgi:hypothetical protein